MEWIKLSSFTSLSFQKRMSLALSCSPLSRAGTNLKTNTLIWQFFYFKVSQKLKWKKKSLKNLYGLWTFCFVMSHVGLSISLIISCGFYHTIPTMLFIFIFRCSTFNTQLLLLFFTISHPSRFASFLFFSQSASLVSVSSLLCPANRFFLLLSLPPCSSLAC